MALPSPDLVSGFSRPDSYTASADADDFTPFSHLVEPRERRSLAQSDIDPDRLSPYQRALLTLDGTVTQFIEAYALDSVTVTRLRQGRYLLQNCHPWLQTEPGTEILAREVILQGGRSQTLYVHAASLLVISRIPAELVAQLETDSGGIGRILLGSQIENRRELLWFGRESIDRFTNPDNDCLSRYYRVMICGRPVMLINEKFPANLRYPSDIHPSAA
ncbi:MAG: hypothetical protein RLZZ226_235 [Pseudomonadota bacterium]|jgi:chorismate-pyruvate lyase